MKLSVAAFIFALFVPVLAANCDPYSGSGNPCARPGQSACGGSPAPQPSGMSDGTTGTTGGVWNQNCVFWSGTCERVRGLLIKGADDKFGGNGLGYVTINKWVDVGQDDVAGGPNYAGVSNLGSQGGSNSLFDGEYDALGIGMKSLIYNNERIFIDDGNALGANIGTTCNSTDARDGEMLTYIASFGNAHVEGSPANSANDDILHASTAGSITSSISTGDGDGGRQTGSSNNCNGETVQLWAMNVDSTDVKNLALDYMNGKLGLVGSHTYVSPSVPGNTFWKATPAPGIANPNGDASHPIPSYDSTKVGAASCYDLWYSDVSGPYYGAGNGGGGLGGGPWTLSFELDPTATTGGTKGVWDWTQSTPGMIHAELDWTNFMVKPLGSGGSYCNDGSKYQIWFNGAGNSGGVFLANDTNHTWATSQTCNADEYGGNALGSGQGTATNVAGASLENTWQDFNAGYLSPKEWVGNLNCMTDVLAETSSIFFEEGGHSQLFDTSYDGYDMVAHTQASITGSSSAQTVSVDNAGIQGSPIGQNAVPLFVVDATNGNEIVSDSGQSGTTTIKAIFLKNHPSNTVIRTLSPESDRITVTALDYLMQTDARTVVQDAWWNTGQGSSFTNHYDVGHYPEEDFHGAWVTTPGTYIGNSVLTDLTAQANSGQAILTIQADNGSKQTCTSNCWNGTRDMWVGQKLNLFDPGTTPHLETVTVASIDSSTQIHVSANLTFTHAAGAILRGSQAGDCVQQLGDGNFYADQSTSGGSCDLSVGGTFGEDGVTGGSNPHRPSSVLDREATSGTYMGQGPLFKWAVVVNDTNKAVPISSLYAANGCTSHCLTNNYAHYCGALILNGNATDDTCLGRTPPVNTTGTLSGNVFTPSTMTGIKVFALYLLDTGANLETVCVASVTGTTATLGTSVQSGNCKAGGFAHTHTGTVALTSSSSTITFDNQFDGGGGTICGYGGPFNTLSPFNTFSTSHCAALTATSNTDSADSIPPMTGDFFFQ